MINSFEPAAHADRPGHRRATDRQDVFYLIKQLHRLAALTVELVDECHDRGIAQAADIHQFDRALFDAFGAVDDHQRRIDGGQRTIGVLGKILMAGCIEQIDDVVAVGKLHDRRGHRYSPLLFQRHPVRSGMATRLAPLDRAGELDRATEQQQLFSERRFPRIGMGNDCKCSPPTDLTGQTWHLFQPWKRREFYTRRGRRSAPVSLFTDSSMFNAYTMASSRPSWER